MLSGKATTEVELARMINQAVETYLRYPSREMQ
jgi:hypothetical protein